MDVSYTINRLQLRGTPGPLEPREPRINPDGTLEIGIENGPSLLFSPTASLSSALQQLSDDLQALRAIAATDSDLEAEVAELQVSIDALAASGATDSELSQALAPISAAIALLASEDQATATAIAAIQASIAGLDAAFVTESELSVALTTKASAADVASLTSRVSAVEAIDAEINRIDSLILALTARVDAIEFELTPAIDPDFSAFIAAAGISSAAQVGAVEALVTGFKADGIWQLMQAIFPFVGGTDDSHKWNLKDSVTYQLVFAPGTTHDSLKGMLQPNPGTSSATSATVSGFTVADIDVNDYSMGVYYKGSLRSRAPNNRPDIVVGSATPADMAPWMLSGIFRNEDNLVYGVHGSFSSFLNSSPTQGLNVLSSLGNSQFQYHKNGVQVAVQNRSGAVKPVTGGGAEIGCNSLDGTTFAFIGRGLTATQHSQLNARVAAFQAALGRAV